MPPLQKARAVQFSREDRGKGPFTPQGKVSTSSCVQSGKNGGEKGALPHGKMSESSCAHSGYIHDGLKICQHTWNLSLKIGW
eukprot:c46256_g1_i1 orf=2-244(-)